MTWKGHSRMALVEGRLIIIPVALTPWQSPNDAVRRICPGLYLANNSMYMNLSLLLWSFRIAEKPDAPIDMNAYTDTVVSHAAPFDVEFVPRLEESRLREMMGESLI